MDALDPTALPGLAALRDPLGVLSIHIDRDPRDQGARNPRWSVEIRNRVHELRARIAHDLPHGDREIALGTLDRVGDLLADPFAPGGSGRGSAMFVTLGDGVSRAFAFQLPTETRVELGETACLWPLVRVLHLGRPAGLVCVSGSGLAAHDWRMGIAAQVATWTLDVATETWREMRGPAPANPMLAQHAAAQSDRFAQRVEHHVRAFVASRAEDVRDLGREHGWETIVIAADPRLGALLAEGLRGERAGLVQVGRLLDGLTSDELARALWPILERERDRSARLLVERATDAAHRGAGAVLGLPDTLSALEAGRVSRLLLAGDGASAEAGDGTPPQGRMPTPERVPRGRRLLPTEQLIRRAITAHARIVPLDPGQATLLDTTDGVAAFLHGR